MMRGKTCLGKMIYDSLQQHRKRENNNRTFLLTTQVENEKIHRSPGLDDWHKKLKEEKDEGEDEEEE